MGSGIRVKAHRGWLVTLAVLGFLAGGAALAHHSGAMFDRSKVVTLDGTVKKFLFTLPHCWIQVAVTDENGKEVVWDIEASSPQRLVKWGISPKTVPIGAKITLTTHPIRDGRRAGSLIAITLEDGTHLTTEADVNLSGAKQ
jgi:hypothetical protein